MFVGLTTLGWIHTLISLVGIATGIPSAEAADFLVDHLDKLPSQKDAQQKALRHVARYAPPRKTERLASS